MNLKRIKIDDFRNLKNFEITFTQFKLDVNTGEEKEIQTHAIIGQNGAGKSNLIEAIITIFRDLDLKQLASFSYELDYDIRNHNIELKAKKDEEPIINVFDKKGTMIDISKNELNKRFLPTYIFSYYSGKNERIEELFQEHQQYFINHIKKGKDQLRRRFFYCRSGHSQLILLSAMLSNDLQFKQIVNDLNILELDSALFVLKQPYYLKSNVSEKNILEGDERFWYAKGTFVEKFLTKLWELAIAPIDNIVEQQIDFKGRSEKQKKLYLYLKDEKSLRKLGDFVGTTESFFRYLDAGYISDLLEEVKITVKHKDTKGNISFSQLSEGEIQILMVLGLMRITKEDDCLFLLDEPDTHLNPIWKLRYFDEIEKVIKKDTKATLQGNSQIIITTHDPMMIGSLKREQVRIIRKDANGSIVEIPNEDPQGMGVSALLKSEMFGLRSTVDRGTLRRIDRRNYLFALGKEKNDLQNKEYEKLNTELSDLGFATDFRDPTYQLFVQKMALHTKFHKEILTPEEQFEQDKIADDIIKDILSNEGLL